MVVLRITRDVYEIQRDIAELQGQLHVKLEQLGRAEAVVISRQVPAEGKKNVGVQQVP